MVTLGSLVRGDPNRTADPDWRRLGWPTEAAYILAGSPNKSYAEYQATAQSAAELSGVPQAQQAAPGKEDPAAFVDFGKPVAPPPAPPDFTPTPSPYSQDIPGLTQTGSYGGQMTGNAGPYAPRPLPPGRTTPEEQGAFEAAGSPVPMPTPPQAPQDPFTAGLDPQGLGQVQQTAGNPFAFGYQDPLLPAGQDVAAARAQAPQEIAQTQGPMDERAMDPVMQVMDEMRRQGLDKGLTWEQLYRIAKERVDQQGGEQALGTVAGMDRDIFSQLGDVYENLPGNRSESPVPEGVRNFGNQALEAVDVPRQALGRPASRALAETYANLTGWEQGEAFNPLDIPEPSLEQQIEWGSYVTDPLNIIPGIGVPSAGPLSRAALRGLDAGTDVTRAAAAGAREGAERLVGRVTEPWRFPDEVPEILYHGTTRNRAASINTEGLRPQSWLAQTPEDAATVARNQALMTGDEPVILAFRPGTEGIEQARTTLLRQPAYRANRALTGGDEVPLPEPSALRRLVGDETGAARVPGGDETPDILRQAEDPLDEAARVGGSAAPARTGSAAAGAPAPPASAAPADLTERLSGATVDTVVRRIGQADDPASVVDMVRQLDPSQRMELSLAIGKEDPALMRELGSLLARAEAGDIQAAQRLKSSFYRDTGHVTKRAKQLDDLLKAMNDESGSLLLPDLRPGSFADEASALIGVPRTVKASFDLSAPGRQGLALAFRHPEEWVQSWAPMLRAWGSDAGMQRVNREIDKMLAPWQDDAGKPFVNLYRTGGGAETLERVPGFEPQGEGLVSGLLRRIPGLEKSERAYATFLNYQKAKTFDNMATALLRSGETNPDVYRRLGNIIDHATGWGGVPLRGPFERQALFSQRYFSSRFQFLTDPIVEGLMKGDLQTARAATENLVGFMGGMAGLLFLIKETGVADVEFDPRSTDFGKVRIGPQRIDFGAGFLPLIRAATRMATGQMKSSAGDIYPATPATEALKFMRNKLAPIPGEAVSRLLGENAIGEKPPNVLSLEMASNLFMPLIADAVLEAFEETGSLGPAALAGTAELVGGGVTTYDSPSQKRQEALQNVSQTAPQDPEIQRILLDPTTGRQVTQYSRLDSWQRDELARRFPEFAATLEETRQASDSEWTVVGDEKIADTEQAVTKFQQTGNADRFRATLGNISDKYAERYAALDAQSNFSDTGSEWQTKVSGFWDEFGNLTDPEDRDHFMEDFRADLNPAELERFDSILGSADDPMVQQYKNARNYLQENYWEPADRFWETLVQKSPENSPLRKYPTYRDLTRAISEHDLAAREIRNKVGPMLTDVKKGQRYKDAQLDGLLYIWGYSDGVYTKGGMDYALQWAAENDVNLGQPPILGLR